MSDTSGEWVLDPAQQAALDALAAQAPAVVVTGGPGTGKTRLLVEAVLGRARAGVPLSQMVVLTHSRRAGQALRRELVAALGRSVISPRVTTLHGFCLGLQRGFGTVGDEGLPELLTAPEHDFRVRELIENASLERWPDTLRAAVGTRGFASEIRAVLTRVRQLGLDPKDLRLAGEREGRHEWVAIADFFDEYLDVLGFENRLDYAELVHRTRLLLVEHQVRSLISRDVQAVFCDEFAELDVAGLGLLAQLCAAGVTVAGFADPSTSVFGFRGALGARVGHQFAQQLADVGLPAPAVFELATNHRSVAGISNAVQRLSARVGPARPPASTSDDGSVRVFNYASQTSAITHLAEMLREAHHDGLAWHEMAVITREASGQVAALARRLDDLGVPVDVEGDALPLAEQPAVAVLVEAMQVTLAMANGDPIDERAAHRLVMSPMCGLDAGQVRLVGRVLRERTRDQHGASFSSTALVAAALVEGADPADNEHLRRINGLGDLLRSQAARVTADAVPQTIAWQLWSGTTWPANLERTALGHGRGAARANRDLDALVAAFDVMARTTEISGRRGLQKLLDRLAGEAISSDTARESDPRDRGVAVLTAHRAKGLEWPFVVVTSLEEGQWPAGRMPATMLDATGISPTAVGERPTLGEVINAERRAFLLAISRAKQRLVLTSIGLGSETRGLSRFVNELGNPVTEVGDQLRRPATLGALIAELRRASVDPAAAPQLREAAAQQLAKLALVTDSAGRVIAPDAHPSTWWGLNPTDNADPSDQRVNLSATEVEDVLTCPRKWFLSRRAEGAPASTPAMRFGSIVHLLVEGLEKEEITRAEADAQLDAIFAELEFTAPWEAAGERAAAGQSLDNFQRWQAGRAGQLLSTERGFRFDVDIEGSPVTVRGQVDRLELDDEGRVRVIDFKTGKRAPSIEECRTNMQLGLYQWAVQQGCFDDVADGVRTPGAPELVYLRATSRGSASVRSQPPLTAEPDVDSPGSEAPGHWVQQKLTTAVRTVRSGNYVARAGDSCRSCPFATGCPASVREGRDNA